MGAGLGAYSPPVAASSKVGQEAEHAEPRHEGIVMKSPKPRYTMAELLMEAEASGTYPLPVEEREWVDAPAIGLEIDSLADPSGNVDTKDE